MTNRLAVALGSELNAGVPYYGATAASEDVPKIRAALLIIYAGTDPRINAMWPEYEAALKSSGVTYEMQMYEGTLHGFPQQLDAPATTRPRPRWRGTAPSASFGNTSRIRGGGSPWMSQGYVIKCRA